MSGTVDSKKNILVWLPSPIGDAVMSTPALRAIRKLYSNDKIYFIASPAVKDLLTPNSFCDGWVILDKSGPLKTAVKLRDYHFEQVILFKNSLGSAVASFLAGIKTRVGYVRDGRGLFLNSRLYPPKLKNGKFKPVAMVDYYLSIASWLGSNSTATMPVLEVDNKALDAVNNKLQSCENTFRAILVPGGAFGPSKCWPAERFAEVADKLSSKYNAEVLINVAPNDIEIKIAEDIIALSKTKPVNIGKFGFNLSQIKALFSTADIVITNDTGPRHIAIALGKKLVSLFGPNDPAWTETGWEKEIKIVGKAPCLPCAKKICYQDDHICMNSITIEMVLGAVENLINEG